MKKTVLFDKGHIQVYTYKYNTSENIQRKKQICEYKHILMSEFPDCYYKKGGNDNVHRIVNYFSDRNKIEPIYEDTIHESPLGFYYATTERINQADVDNSNKDSQYDRTDTNEYVITVNDTDYHISYFHRVGENIIGLDKRPWELFDNGMEEHFIMDLFDVLKNIKSIVDSQVKKGIIPCIPEYGNIQYDKIHFQNDWQHMMSDIFGYSDGPKFQTNNEKIQAAGFDLKTSFRNM